jgi:hypothetical protein
MQQVFLFLIMNFNCFKLTLSRISGKQTQIDPILAEKKITSLLQK